MKILIKESQYKVLLEQSKPISIEACQSKYQSVFQKAKDWWIKWLSNPITKKKYLNNLNVPKGFGLEKSIPKENWPKYIERINSLKLDYFDKNSTKSYKYKIKVNNDRKEDSVAYFPTDNPNYIMVNCSFINEEPNLLGILIHEMTHAINDVYPFNSPSNVDDVFSNYNSNISPGPKNINISKYNPLIKSTSSKLGVNTKYLEYWLKLAISEQKTNPDYTCNWNEKTANTESIRQLFNLNPGQNITKEMIKPYIVNQKKDGNMYWILQCWALNGFEDINLLLNKINKLAYQDTKPTDNTRLT